MWKKIAIGAGVAIVGAAVYGWFAYGQPMLAVFTGYTAKMACSYHFVSGRDLDHILERELADYSFGSVTVDDEAGIVRAAVGPLADEAVYRPGIGCTLIEGTTAEALREATPELPRMLESAPLRREIDPAVQAVVDAYLEDEALHTRAVLLADARGRVLAEGYGDGFAAGTPHQGWSMTKSLTQALAGILVAQGRLDPAARAPIEAWADPDDPRHAITLRHLLTATDGLDFDEVYYPPSDATKMLFTAPSAAAVAAGRPLAAEPGTRWSYSSGTTNLIAHIVGEELRSEGDTPAAFARRELFAPLGMVSALIEQDSAGDFVGSSFGFMTAEDWARFGLLYLNEGVWNGRRILPEGWAEAAGTLTPASGGWYGQQWWLNDPEGEMETRPYLDLPPTLFRAGGFEGQHVIVLPERGLVLVRLGFTPGDDRINALGRDILAALGDAETRP